MGKKVCEKKDAKKAENSKKKYACKKCGLFSNNHNKLCKAVSN